MRTCELEDRESDYVTNEFGQSDARAGGAVTPSASGVGAFVRSHGDVLLPLLAFVVFMAGWEVLGT